MISNDTIKQSIEEIRNLPNIDFEKSFNLSKICSKLLYDEDSADKAREITIRILDAWNKVDDKTHPIWNDLVEAVGLYPYLVESYPTFAQGIMRHEFHKSKYLEDIYLHEEQMKLSLDLDAKKSLIVSAPTSFGKSLLIEEIVASRKYKNIVIIQPTLALLDETRKKLMKYQHIYKIIVSTNQKPSEEANLFLLTGERVAEYEELPPIDFFVIDEFYKLSMDRDDERAAVLNFAFYKLLKLTNNFYLLGPNIQKIPDGFENRYDAQFIKSTFSTVAVDLNQIVLQDQKQREKILFDLLVEVDGPTLVYCSSPAKANKLVENFVRFCEESDHIDEKKTASEIDLIEWIDHNIHPKWILKKALSYSIGMHHGALPRHIGSSIVDYFNKRKIKYLFCTSTLIEGVNTSAKNVILFDKKKGPKLIDYFDFKNIVGRSGRMKEHFIGRVYKFYQEPPSKETQVDIPFFTQKDAKSELLIQLDPQDVKDKDSTLFKLIESLEPDIKDLVKSNKGVPIEGQLKIIDEIEKNLVKYHNLLSWSGIPKYEQLETTIVLAWNHLLTERESRSAGVFTPKQLTYVALQYNTNKSMVRLIKSTANSKYMKEKFPDEEMRIQDSINKSFQMRRHWFEYKLPKLLKTLSEIQDYIFKKNNLSVGNYHFFADQIENNFLPKNLAILLEYDIPVSAVNKLRKFIKKDLEFEQLINEVKKLDLDNIGLIDYEKNKINNSL